MFQIPSMEGYKEVVISQDTVLKSEPPVIHPLQKSA
jgi:ATP-dependent Clp protease ATP-binding subunit ClpX